MGYYILDISKYYPEYEKIQLFVDLYSISNLSDTINDYKYNQNFQQCAIKKFFSNFIYITLTINIITNNPYNYSITIPYSILQDIGLTNRSIVVHNNNVIPNITYEQLYMIMLTNDFCE